MKLLISKASQIGKNLERVVRRFPFAILSSVIVAFLSFYFLEVEPDFLNKFEYYLLKLLFTSTLGIFVFISLEITNKKLLPIVGILFLVFYYFSLPAYGESFENIISYSFRHIFLSLLFFIAIFWSSFVKDDVTNKNFWSFSKRVFIGFILSILFTFIVIAGANLALLAIDKLFDININGKRYLQLDILITFLFGINYFLSFIPNKKSGFDEADSRVELFFVKYILTPISVIYFIILYLYSIKILFLQEWPKGIISWLVILFSTVAILTYLFWTPIYKREKFRRWFWLAILFQTFMLFSAIGIRIEEYSFTESRYMVLALGIWLFIISLYFLFSKSAKLKWIFISLSLIIAVTQYGKFSAYEVSKRAQLQRLASKISELKKYELEKIPLKLKYEISDITNYLAMRYGASCFKEILPDITKEYIALKERRDKIKKKLRELKKENRDKDKVKISELDTELAKIDKQMRHNFAYYVADKLGFEYVTFWEHRDKKNYRRITFRKKHNMQSYAFKIIKIKGYDYMLSFESTSYEFNYRFIKERDLEKFNNSKYIVDEKYDYGYEIKYDKNFILTIKKDSKIATINIEKFYKKLKSKLYNSDKNTTEIEVDKENLILKGSSKDFKYKIEIYSIEEIHIDDKKLILFRGEIFVKEI